MKNKLSLPIVLIGLNLFMQFKLHAEVVITTDTSSGCSPLTVAFSTDLSGTYYEWYFGDGSYSSSANPSYTYTEPGNYTVYVYIYDAGYIYLDDGYTEINVTGAGTEIDMSENVSCLETDITFQVFFDAYSYNWDFGDGTTSSAATPTHSYATAGIYNVSLIVETSCGTDTIQDQVTIVNDLPIDGYYSVYQSDEKLCPNEELYISIDGYPNQGEIEEYSIDFGDGTTVNEYYGYHSYQDTGVYYIQGTFINSCGNDTTIFDSVHVTENLEFSGSVSMYINTKVGCTGTQYSFQTWSEFPEYIWDFGDGTQSTERYSSHYYQAEGKYAVSLTVTDYCGNDSTITDTIVVRNDLPFEENIIITADAKEVCPGAVVNFYAPSGLETYRWDLGDGRVSSQKNPTAIYETIGNHPVSLTVTNYCGRDTTVYDTIVVKDNIPIKEYLSYSINVDSDCDLKPVEFTVSSSNLKSVEWNFGDNNISRKTSTTHQYNEPGSYTVLLMLENWCGADTTISETLDLTGNSELNGSYYINLADAACINSFVNFSPAYNSNTTVFWDFGDGTTTTSRYPTHYYKDLGMKIVSLTFTNECGKDTTVYDSIEIRDDIKITTCSLVHETTVCSGSSTYFYVSANGVNTATWDFGDGQTQSGTSISHTYNTAGEYDIACTLTNNCGDDTTLYSTIEIRDDLTFSNDFYVSINKKVNLYENVYFSVYNYSDKIETYRWDFGDGITYNTTESYINYKYQELGTYSVSCTVANACGDEKTFTGTVIVVDAIFDFEIELSTSETCPDDPVSFDLNSNSSIKNCSWKLSDGYENNAIEFSHAFEESGVYRIEVTASDFYGNSLTQTEEVRIVDESKIDEVYLSLSGTEFCPNEVIDFYTDSQYDSILWDFGDGTTSNAVYAKHAYTSVGTYDVSLTVVNNCNDKLTRYTKVLVVEDKGISSYFYCASTVCPGQEFSAYCYNEYDSYEWDMGDGNTMTGRNIVYQYTEPGRYNITLKTSNKCGISTTYSRRITVTNETRTIYPYLSIPIKACLNAEIEFYQYETYASYLWDFGDGTRSNEMSPTHSYSSTGSYNITLTVTDECGNTGSITKSIMIVDKLLIDNISFYMSEQSLCAGDSIDFYASGDNGLIYSWNFGDANTAEGDVVSHAFASTGVYNVQLLAENGCGDTTSVYRTVETGNTEEELYLDYDYTDNVCVNQEAGIYFAAIEDGSYMFDFGDGTTITTVEQYYLYDKLYDMAKHAYSEPGIYDLHFEVTNSCGQSISKTVAINVGENVPVNGDVFCNSDQQLCTNTDIEFIATEGTTYVWNFGDGSETVNSSGSISAVTHRYSSTGTYTVSVEITNGCGNTATYSTSVTVDCTGISSLDKSSDEPQVKLFPNPAHDKLYLVTNELVEGDYFEIYNILGETIRRRTIEKNEELLDISMMRSGVYVIKVHTSDQEYSIRFIKQ